MDTKIFSPGCMTPPPDDGSLAEQSEAWLVHLNSGEARVNDLLALQRWRSKSLAHEQAWIEMVRLWRLIGIALRQYAARYPRADRLVPTVTVCGASRPHRRFMH